MLTNAPNPTYPPIVKSDEADYPAEIRQLLKIASQSLLTNIAQLCEGALIVDRQARIVWMNEHYPKRLGLVQPEAAIGQPVESILPQSLMREVVESGRPIMLDIMNFGTDSFVVLRLPLRDQTGQVIGGIGLLLLDDARNLAPIVSRYNQICRELNDTRAQLALARRAKYTLSSLVGGSSRLMDVKMQARRAARTCAPVLIQGETGTGKELLAQAIHNASQRADKPFVAVNIAAIPDSLLEAEFFGVVAGAYTGADRRGREGKFKLADGGTLFLDEIGDMPLTLQAKLLRVLQEGEYEALGSDRLLQTNVRIVSATSRDLAQDVAQGRFRADLYYRLNVVTLEMSPLRERLEDLPMLCEYLLDSLSHKHGWSTRELAADALSYLAQYDWPGNVRELQNILERASMMSDAYTLTVQDVSRFLPALSEREPPTAVFAMSLPPTTATNPLTLAETIAQAEWQAIHEALQACGGNKAKAAARLGISRTSLYEKLSQYRAEG